MDFLSMLFHFWNYSKNTQYSRSQYTTLKYPVVCNSSGDLWNNSGSAFCVLLSTVSPRSSWREIGFCQNYWKIDAASPVSPGKKGCLRIYILSEGSGSLHLFIASTEMAEDTQKCKLLLLQGSVNHWCRQSFSLSTYCFSFILFAAEKRLNVLKAHVPTFNWQGSDGTQWQQMCRLGSHYAFQGT